MSDRGRLLLFFPALLVFFALFTLGAKNMPAWGDYRGPYGDAVARLGVYERHTTDIVNAINYDYRAFDTLGEEFILFTAVVGVMLLLRKEDKGTKSAANVGDRPRLSTTTQVACIAGAMLMAIFGFYLGLHGQLSPGGGFQAGVVLATAPLLIYVAQNTHGFKRLTSHSIVEVVEAIGAGSYALIGVAPLLAGLPLLTNILPLGDTGSPFSSGTIALISATVGVEVTAAFLLVIYTYLEEIIDGELQES